MPLEVVPDLLDRVEFSHESGKAFEMEQRKSITNCGDRWPLVDADSLPEHDDRSAQMLEQKTQEFGYVNSFAVVLPELNPFLSELEIS